ncbi:amidohydrolase [Neolewinella persica]|uniref:amidohydrolase n=1 Tax=Neolewinella persica TaxID=70998 RepID=UPI00035EBFA0|nr:amidohydrolase [Neolewinella persica]
MYPELQHLRKDLHQYPELSGEERETAQRIVAFISDHHPPTELITGIGGHGLAFVYDYPATGPTVMIRCELDALPIQEPNTFEHRSRTEGVSHKCGHDGHMGIVAGLTLWLRKQSFSAGRVVLFFQSAEETGKGAEAALCDDRFLALAPDYVFALHNIPGAPLHEIILTPRLFSPTVQSFTIFLKGKESHASEPENGINPALATAALIDQFARCNIADPQREDFAILTPVHLAMGQKAYGISPGTGEMHYTIRTWTEAEMGRLKTNLEGIVENIASNHRLSWSINWLEYFPATVNDDYCRELVLSAARANGFSVTEQATPFRFGEDFGWLSRNHRVAMFGLGAGKDCPALHHAEYDFPEVLMATGVKQFGAIIASILS